MLAVLLALATGGDTVALKDSLAVALKDSLAVALKDSLAVALKDSLAVALKDSLAVALKDSLAVAGYWQQQVAYVISAALDEPSAVLTGHVRIAYVNRSPDTLHDFFVHQYLNAFRPGSRWAAADSAEGRGRVPPLAGPHLAVA